MEIMNELILFSGKMLMVFVFIALVLMLLGTVKAKRSATTKSGSMSFGLLNNLYLKRQYQILATSQQAEKAKALKAALRKKETAYQGTLYVIDFDGDVSASQVGQIREEITTILLGAKSGDEVLVRLNSGGGIVHTYGLASAQLMRLRNAGIKLTVAVDEVAASGGYMMACVADRIIASPFAIIGSIGVVTQMPNFNRFLQKHDIDYEQLTSGEFKRTITMFGQNTLQGREKLQQGLGEVHHQFRTHVKRFRPHVDLERAANGDDWSGERSLHLNLVDEIMTSDEYLMEKMSQNLLLCTVKYKKPQSTANKLSVAFASACREQITSALSKAWFKSSRPF